MLRIAVGMLSNSFAVRESPLARLAVFGGRFNWAYTLICERRPHHASRPSSKPHELENRK